MSMRGPPPCYHELFTGALGGFFHLHGFGHGSGDGLFAYNVLTRLESVNGGLHVNLVGGEDVDRVDLVHLKELLVVGESVLYVVLFRPCFQSLLVDIGESHHFDIIHVGQGGKVRPGGDAANSYKTYFKLFHYVLRLNNVIIVYYTG